MLTSKQLAPFWRVATTPFLEPKSPANLLKLFTLNKALQSFETPATMNQSRGSNVAQALKLQHLKQSCG